jgi:hypothetical protein
LSTLKAIAFLAFSTETVLRYITLKISPKDDKKQTIKEITIFLLVLLCKPFHLLAFIFQLKKKYICNELELKTRKAIIIKW